MEHWFYETEQDSEGLWSLVEGQPTGWPLGLLYSIEKSSFSLCSYYSTAGVFMDAIIHALLKSKCRNGKNNCIKQLNQMDIWN